jgi:hypothetical protein
VSRAHYDLAANKEIMGVDYDMRELDNLGVNIKLSLLIFDKGIRTWYEVLDYLSWASQFKNIRKVVIRQLFDAEYPAAIKSGYVSSEKVYNDLHAHGKWEPKFTEQGNPIFKFYGDSEIDVEVEFRSCACEIFNPVMRGNGNIYVGWTDKLWRGHGQ